MGSSMRMCFTVVMGLYLLKCGKGTRIEECDNPTQTINVEENSNVTLTCSGYNDEYVIWRLRISHWENGGFEFEFANCFSFDCYSFIPSAPKVTFLSTSSSKVTLYGFLTEKECPAVTYYCEQAACTVNILSERQQVLSPGAIVGVTMAVMVVAVFAVVVVVVVVLWRRGWVLPCHKKDNEQGNDPRIAGREGPYTVSMADVTIPETSASDQDELQRAGHYEPLRLEDTGQKSVYSSVSNACDTSTAGNVGGRRGNMAETTYANT